jgi:hypothetical protein
MRISSRAAAKFYWPTPYSLTASTASSAAARRVPASSRPAHRDAAKTIPLRRIPQVRFSRFPGLDAPGAEHIFLGLNTLVDVSISRNFLRIDNPNSIAESTSFLNLFIGRSMLLNYLFSIVYVYFAVIRQAFSTTRFWREIRSFSSQELVFCSVGRFQNHLKSGVLSGRVDLSLLSGIGHQQGLLV